MFDRQGTVFADVILPLPLQGTFTYSIPQELAAKAAAGSRVLVQFGKKKYYTGVIASVTTIPPEKPYEIKEVMALLDDYPVTTRLQLRLWEWISEYYLCPIGDVLKAALPAGLKPESQTRIGLNPAWEREETNLLEEEAALITILESRGPMTMEDIVAATDNPEATLIVDSLIEQGVVEVAEHVVERYRPKRETMVRLLIPRGDNAALHDAMESVSRAPRQEKLLMAWLELSGWMRREEEMKEVSRQELLEKSGVTAASLKGLQEKGLMETYRKVINRFATPVSSVQPLAPLSAAQERALKEITESFAEKTVTLLHGVTSSGKTEVYSHLISRVIARGESVLYLVPEISLTTQLTDRLRRVFGDELIVYHSKFTDNERVDIYRRILSDNPPRLILGVRSSVFLPIVGLGLIIVDEEHESSFKQYDPAPRYNARDAAIMLASQCGAKVLLGSATPSIETYYKATHGKYGLVTLSERFGEACLPEVEIIDMREARKKKEAVGILSNRLRYATAETLRGGKQAIMFQNRRGFAPVVICRQCGWTPKCENCDVALVYHKQSATLHCHYCGFTRTLPNVCPACGVNDIDVYGYGTERIAEIFHKAFDGYRVARMDLDTTRNKDSQQEIIEEFARKETDILVGTQMVTKGLDFAGVELVGVLSADTLMNFPDFRSNERAFNMLEQVAGRAGRRGQGGKVMIQTSRPDEPLLDFVRNHDYLGFYQSEIADREAFGYPPFSRVINIYLRNKDSRKAEGAARLLADALRQTFGQRVLGPNKPFVSRVNTWYLQTIMLKIEASASMKRVKEILRAVYESLAGQPEFKGTMIHYDVDPA